MAMKDNELLPQEGIFGYELWFRCGKVDDGPDERRCQRRFCPLYECLLEALGKLANIGH